jgi:hypothetical protein
MYTISCTTNGLPIQGCDDTIVIKKEQPPFPELKCELSYSPEDKIIEGVIHTIDITCDTV